MTIEFDRFIMSFTVRDWFSGDEADSSGSGEGGSSANKPAENRREEKIEIY